MKRHALLGLVLFACTPAASPAPPPSDGAPVAAPEPRPPLPADCTSPQGLFSVAEVLATEHPCSSWVRGTMGRAVRNGAMSGVLWTTNTPVGTGVMLSALHTLGEGWVAPAGTAAEATVKDPSVTQGVARIVLPAPDGSAANWGSAMFPLFFPSVPADQTGNKMHDIRPRHDFFLAAVDGQRLDQPDGGAHLGVLPGPLEASSPEVPDPEGRLKEGAHADAAAGDRLLMLGYPMADPLGGALTASVGVVLSPEEVEAAMEELRAAGDEEGDLAYDPEVEHLVRGTAVAGMSGGGIFDGEGHLVGVLVRGSTETDPPGYVRFVRMPFVVEALRQTLAATPPEVVEAARPYLPAAEGEAAPQQ